MLLEDLQLILKVSEFRSITAAAESLDMRAATASAALKRVENALGAELFVRTTRHLRLSSAGERYLPQCEQALLLLEQARLNMMEDLGVVEGELRIALSSDLGRNLVTPWLDEFMEQHPQLSLRANISDSNIDFYRDSVDVALRYGSPSDENHYGFKICDVPRLLCAAQSYIDIHAAPEHPQQLPSHNALLYQLYDLTHDNWEFSQQGSRYKIKVNGNRISNDGDQVRRWCVAGKGLAVKSCLDMSSDLLSGHVIGLMRGFEPKATELWLMFPSRSSITPAARLLRDMLQEKCKGVLQQLQEQDIID